MAKYYRFDARFNSRQELSEKEFNKIIKRKYIIPIWDDYWQRFDYDSYVDIRDSIVRIFYFRREVNT